MKASLKETICHILQRLGLISDWVVEQGTSGMWIYRKWNSGIAECWGIYRNNSVSVNSAWGNIYEGFIGNLSYPTNLFAVQPTVLATFEHNGAAAWIEMAGGRSVTNTGNIWANRPIKTDAAATYGVSIHAIGLWKAFSGGVVRNILKALQSLAYRKAVVV